jgi:hypothetical protein
MFGLWVSLLLAAQFFHVVATGFQSSCEHQRQSDSDVIGEIKGFYRRIMSRLSCNFHDL